MSNIKTRKTALYIRVSTDSQFEEGYSVDAQKEKLEQYCKLKDIKIIILTLSQDELLQRSRLRNEEPEIQANLLKINRAYVDMALKYDIPIFNTTINSLEEIVEYIDRKEK